MKRLTVAIEVEVDAAEGQTEADVLDTLVWALDTLADLDRPLTTLDASDLDLAAVRVVAVKQRAVSDPSRMNHDTYVYPEGRKWRWRCLTCETTEPTVYPRRMDADDAATNHCYGDTQ